MSGYEGDKLDRLTEEGWTDTQTDTDAKKEMRRWQTEAGIGRLFSSWGYVIKLSPSRTSKPVIFLYKLVLFRENNAFYLFIFTFRSLSHKTYQKS